MILTTVVVLPSIASIVLRRLFIFFTENVTFSHLFLHSNGVLTPAQIIKRGWTLVLTSFFYRFWKVDENHTRRSIVSGSSEERAECGCILLSVLVGSKINVGWAFSPTILNLGGRK